MAGGEHRPRAGDVARAVSVFAVALLFALLRTARPPNDWAEAHWLLDYRFGLVKRGLPGQLLTWAADLAGVEITASLVALVSYALLLVFAATMLLLAVRIAARDAWRPATVAALTAFLASPFAVYAGHLTGYFDHLFLALGVLSCWLALRGRVWAGALVQVTALFTHESCALLTVPTFVLATLLRPANGRALHAALLLPVATAIAMAFVLSTPPAGFEAGFTERLRLAGFVEGGMDENVPKMLAFSLPTMWTLVTTFGDPRRLLVAALLALPALLVLLRCLARAAPVPPRSFERLCCYGAVLAPLPMLAVAWDVERIVGYSLWTALVALWLRSEATEPRPAPRWLLPAALVAIAVGTLVTPALLDDAQDRLGLGVRAFACALLLAAMIAAARAGSARAH